MIDYRKFEMSLRHLERQYENYCRLGERPGLSDLDREAIAESVIQRFEVCYDVLWKILKRYLVEVLGLPNVPSSPKPVFRLAAESALLPGGAEVWLYYADVRTGTSYDHSGGKAEECPECAGRFAADADALLQTLAGSGGR